MTYLCEALFFLTSKPIFQNSCLQFTICVWAVWKWIMGLPEQLKCRRFRGHSAPWTPDQGFALDPPWALQHPGPQHHFQVFKFWQHSPLYMLISQYIRGVQIIHTCFACIQGRQLEKINFKLKDLPGTKLFIFWLHVTTCSLLYLQFPWTSLPTLQKQST